VDEDGKDAVMRLVVYIALGVITFMILGLLGWFAFYLLDKFR
jgi:hypothetical protein